MRLTSKVYRIVKKEQEKCILLCYNDMELECKYRLSFDKFLSVLTH